ncbi:MAG: N-formylglutamate amidohydrolase [Bryobacteraceae bacterium]
MISRTLRPAGSSRFVLICDHASNHVPEELHGLGLPASELQRHIAWDIGAAAVTEGLSEILDAPAVLCGVSRLVIDCNRHHNASGLIPEVSDGTVIPGNLKLSEADRAARIERYFQPYHAAVEAVMRRESEPILISMHSMTPSLAGVARTCQISLSSYVDRRLTDPMLAALRAWGDIAVGDNDPYDLDPTFDFSTPYHALQRNLLHLQVEIRQDEIGDAVGQRWWAERIAKTLTSAMERVTL